MEEKNDIPVAKLPVLGIVRPSTLLSNRVVREPPAKKGPGYFL